MEDGAISEAKHLVRFNVMAPLSEKRNVAFGANSSEFTPTRGWANGFICTKGLI